jgi:hypothetical protein
MSVRTALMCYCQSHSFSYTEQSLAKSTLKFMVCCMNWREEKLETIVLELRMV